MSHRITMRRSLAATAALVAATWGAAALPAQADDTSTPEQTQGQHDKSGDKTNHGHHGHHADNGDHADQGDKTNAGHHGDKSGDKGHVGDKGGHTGDHGGKGGDPAGNNGTVKIAPYGEMDGIPQNSPHQGCVFQVEWYGYDEGADIVSQVSFAMQAPTKDVALTVDGPSSVFVGGDPATGAGTDSGLDGTEAYTLSFDGEPHPQQGYHVKLTVATPRSQGNDTKTKVFWVQGCEDVSGTDTGDTGGTGGTTGGTDTGDDTGTDTGGTGGAGDEIEVLGVQASTGPQASSDQGTGAQVAGAQVPTSVDAGEDGPRTFADWMRSPLPLLGGAFGLALIAFAARRRLGSTRA